VQRVGQPLQSANLDNPAISRVQLLHLMSPILRSARTEVNPIILLHSKKGMPPVNYKLAIDGWPESERIVIRNGTTSPSVIASFPLDFVRRGGDNTWQYILDMVENVVDPEPGHPATIRDSTGLPVNPDAPPISGEFWFEHSGEYSVLHSSRFDPHKFLLWCCVTTLCNV
jgi:hypothetical protein